MTYWPGAPGNYPPTNPYPSGTTNYPSGTAPYPSGTNPYPSGTAPYPSGTGMPFPNPTGTTGGYEFPYGGPQPTGTNYPGMPGYPQPLTPNYPPRSNSFSGPPTTGYPSGFPPGASLAPAGYPPQVVNTNPNTGTGSGYGSPYPQRTSSYTPAPTAGYPPATNPSGSNRSSGYFSQPPVGTNTPPAGYPPQPGYPPTTSTYSPVNTYTPPAESRSNRNSGYYPQSPVATTNYPPAPTPSGYPPSISGYPPRMTGSSSGGGYTASTGSTSGGYPTTSGSGSYPTATGSGNYPPVPSPTTTTGGLNPYSIGSYSNNSSTGSYGSGANYPPPNINPFGSSHGLFPIGMGIMSGSGTYPSSSVFPDGSSFYPPEHQQQPIQQPQYGGGKVSHIQAMLIKKMQEEQAAMQQAQAYLQQQNAMQQTVTNNNQTPAPTPGVVQDPAVQELVSRNVHSIKQLQMKRQEEAAKQDSLRSSNTALENKLKQLEALTKQREENRASYADKQAADQKVEAERRAKAEKEAAEAREAERIRKEEQNKLQMSFYSSVIDTCSIIATNSNRVKSLLLDNEEDMFDNTSLANSLAFDVAALLETTTRGLEEMCKDNLVHVDIQVHKTVKAKIGALSKAIFALGGHIRAFNDPQAVARMKGETPAKREDCAKQLTIAVSFAIKEIITELEKQKLASSNVKDLFSLAPAELNVLAKTKEAQPKFVGTRLKLEPIPYNATKPYASYDERKVKALQGFFSKFAAGARWRNLVQEYRASPGARRGHTRFNVLQEILSTEESYIASLDRCIKFWLGPVRQALKDKRAIMTEKEITTIFSSIETIIQLNQQVVVMMQSRLSKFPHDTRFGDILLSFAAPFKLYVDYVNKFDGAMTAYTDIKKNNSKFIEWQDSCQKKAQSNVDLAAILIMPVQRMPRYELLLRELIKYTPPTHIDIQNLEKAAHEMKQLNKFINDQKQAQENRIKLARAEEVIKTPVPLILFQPHRLYVHDGSVELMYKGKRIPGHLYLMNDLIIITYLEDPKQKDVGHVLISSTPLSKTLAVKDNGENFIITDSSDSSRWEVWCQSPHQKNVWVKELNETIQTTTLKNMLDSQIERNKAQPDFKIFSARYGQLNDPSQSIDVTNEIQRIITTQGGDRLILKAESKVTVFPKGESLKCKKRQLEIKFMSGKVIKTKVFGDADAIQLDSHS